MRYYLFFIVLFTISACKEAEEEPVFSQDYGGGLYIYTSNGVSFYKDGVVKNQIFNEVNGVDIGNVNKIKFQDDKAYILTENILYVANIETFQEKGSSSSDFLEAVDFEFVNPENRIFVVDKGDAKVKVVDLDLLQITQDIETGDSTTPVSIVNNYAGVRSFTMNGGGSTSLNDSTIVAIDYKNGVEPIADFMGSLFVGFNPNSAVYGLDLMVLCKGIYNPNDLIFNTESTLAKISAWNMKLLSSQTLSGIYNANNLISNNYGTEYYFTAEGGFYKMNSDGTGISLIDILESDILYYQDEVYSYYSVIDSTTYFDNRDVLYINDSQNSKNTLYKYDLDANVFLDTIIVNGEVRGVNFY